MLRRLIVAFCVLVAAPVSAQELSPSALEGRWSGMPVVRATAVDASCTGENCKLVLDITRCGGEWCGVQVGAGQSCGATSLKVRAKKEDPHLPWFEGTLSLVAGSEPYTIEGNVEKSGEDGTLLFRLNGDTGGEYRVWRRSFPFHITMRRIAELTCRSERPVS